MFARAKRARQEEEEQEEEVAEKYLRWQNVAAAIPISLPPPPPLPPEEEESDSDDDDDDEHEDDPDFLKEDDDTAGNKPNVPLTKNAWLESVLKKLPKQPDVRDNGKFMHLDTTQRTNPETRAPEVLLWGVNEVGNSVCAVVPWFRPYFYADIYNDAKMEQIRTALEAHLKRTYDHDKNRSAAQYILECIRVDGRDLSGFHCNAPKHAMYKIVMASPAHVREARECLDFCNKSVTTQTIKTFEANVPFELRFMVDHQLHGCQWIEVGGREKSSTLSTSSSSSPGEAQEPVLKRAKPNRISNAQIEHVIESAADFCPLSLAEKSDIAPVRILSFDIEVLSKGNKFPSAKEDNPVICIATALEIKGKGLCHGVVFTTAQKCGTNIKDCDDVVICKDEKELLLAFSTYVQLVGADILTGWNVNGFDLPYLATRSEMIGIKDEFLSFSRLIDRQVRIQSRVFQSKAYGAKTVGDVSCDGRIVYDGLDFLLRGVMKKYRMYTLNYIAQEVLKTEQKEDVPYFMIPLLYMGDEHAQTHLNAYCFKDAILPPKILDKLQAVVNGIEQARVTGVPIKWLLSRGQGMKTFSNILRFKDGEEHVPTVTERNNTDYTAGGYVREPLRGYYNDMEMLITLDFASLYPSIMQAYNICYSTVVSLKWAKENLQPGDYWIPPPALDLLTPEEEAEMKSTPKGRKQWAEEAPYRGKQPDYVFVKKHIREGILPAMLEKLVATRRAAVREKEKVDPEKDPLLYSVLDGRQNALKVVCNSVYGFLKAYIWTDPRLMSAVTGWGRTMIKQVAHIIETQYQNCEVVDVDACRALGMNPEKEPGYDPATGEPNPDLRPRRIAKARIIYGDTDSVMVSFGKLIIPDCVRLGKSMAARCTAVMEKPNKLEFESIKLVSIFLNKKRYAAIEILESKLKRTFAESLKVGALNIKGLEGKRRDNAPIGGETQMKMLDIVLREQNVPKAFEYVKGVLSNLLRGKIEVSKLIITKGLSKTAEEYKKGGTKQQHVELAKRIEERCDVTGETPYQTGDRVPFIMVAGTKNSMACELAEDPVYAQKNGIPINTHFYVHKQIWPATIRIAEAILNPEMCKKIKSSMPMHEREKLEGHKRLFVDTLPHMRVRKQARLQVGSQHGISKMAQVEKGRCLGCNVLCEDAVCEDCDPWILKRRAQEWHHSAKKKQETAWNRCLKCMGASSKKDVIVCTNKTCENLYRRQQCDIDVEDLGNDLQRLYEGDPPVM